MKYERDMGQFFPVPEEGELVRFIGAHMHQQAKYVRAEDGREVTFSTLFLEEEKAIKFTFSIFWHHESTSLSPDEMGCRTSEWTTYQEVYSAVIPLREGDLAFAAASSSPERWAQERASHLILGGKLYVPWTPGFRSDAESLEGGRRGYYMGIEPAKAAYLLPPDVSMESVEGVWYETSSNTNQWFYWDEERKGWCSPRWDEIFVSCIERARKRNRILVDGEWYNFPIHKVRQNGERFGKVLETYADVNGKHFPIRFVTTERRQRKADLGYWELDH